jgi:hypothetical protein
MPGMYISAQDMVAVRRQRERRDFEDKIMLANRKRNIIGIKYSKCTYLIIFGLRHK